MTSQIPSVVWILIIIQIGLIYLYIVDIDAPADNAVSGRRIPRSVGSKYAKTFIGETIDYSGNYRIVRFYMSTIASNDWSFEDVTLATQTSINNLHYIIQLAKRWEGLISCAIFAPNIESSFVTDVIEKLRFCYPILYSVTFHLVYPSVDLADMSLVGNWLDLGCDEIISEIKHFGADNYQGSTPYPHNVLRNVARSGANTEFIYLIDIDTIPSTGLREQFVNFASEKKLWGKTDDQVVYVTPAFEMQDGYKVPETKNELLSGISENYIRPFHNESCHFCHFSQNTSKWSKVQVETDQQRISVAFVAEWMEAWEPFYIAHRSVPLHDERFRDFGFDRRQQICELYLGDYQFAVLDNAFLVHHEWKHRTNMTPQKLASNHHNWYLFNYHFKDEVQRKYKTNRTCSPIRPLSDGSVIFGPGQAMELENRLMNDDFHRYDIQRQQMGKPVSVKGAIPFAWTMEEAELYTMTQSVKKSVVTVHKYIADELKQLQKIQGNTDDAYKKENRDMSWED